MPRTQKPKKTRKDDYDLAWKALSERFFRELIEFCNPEAFAEIDWAKGFESLDKDLKKLRPDAGASNRWADKLVKVWRRPPPRPGKEYAGHRPGLVYLHFEFQNQRDDDLPLRMFTTNYRVFEHYQCPVTSFVILGDRGNWRPESWFGWDFWGTRMGLEFPIVKLWEYNQPKRWAELEVMAETNAFAFLVMAHLKSKETQRKNDRRYVWKRTLFRKLLESKYDRQDIVDLLRFVDWLMQLPKAMENRLDKEMEEMETTQEIPYLTHWERRGIRKGRREGLREGQKKGMLEGREKGLQEGLRNGKAELMKSQAQHRFGELPAWAIERFDRADVDALEGWSHRLLDAERLEEIFSAD